MSNPSEASTSKQAEQFTEDDDNLLLNIKDEEAEIARLEVDNKIDTSNTPVADVKDDERIAKIKFHCSACDMHEMVHYFGKKPPFVYGVKFLEDTFVMRDPFQPAPQRWKPKAEYFIALGANCRQCEKTVCKDIDCSFYYTTTYCLDCATENLKSFPLEAQCKLRKQLSAK